MTEKTFDIIIVGAGMSGLSLCYRALKSGIWRGKQIAIIDQHIAPNNDKTWCFWENKKGPFEHIIFKSWEQLNFVSNAGDKKQLDSADYTYKMLRSADFHNECLDYLNERKNVTFIEDEISKQSSTNTSVALEGKLNTYTASVAFNSVFSKPEIQSNEKYFLQHFKGWFIESTEAIFDKNSIHLMDFRPSQEHGCTFMYVLPLSPKKALVEYTLFTKTILNKSQYTDALNDFIRNELKINQFRVYHDEYGVIPMTDHQFSRYNGRIINIGSAGGDTRASTGYTFQNTQKTISEIIKHYKKNTLEALPSLGINKKHRILDSTILKVLDKNAYAPHQLFTDLFAKTPSHKIFRFLDGESSWKDDLSVMKSLKAKYFILPFIQSLKQVFASKK